MYHENLLSVIEFKRMIPVIPPIENIIIKPINYNIIGNKLILITLIVRIHLIISIRVKNVVIFIENFNFFLISIFPFLIFTLLAYVIEMKQKRMNQFCPDHIIKN